MQTTGLKHIAFLAEYCAENDISDIVISPGSRNAPLIIAFESHKKIRTHLIHDERSAAFFALGLAEASGNPVALTCTSGSALLNYAPAIAEAYYRQIPLLVLSADRPSLLIDQGDGQTIRQNNVYANIIKLSLSFPENGENILMKANECAHKAIVALKSVPKGPVHINIPVDEPLYEISDHAPFELEKEVISSKPLGSEINWPELYECWNSTQKKLVIVGQLEPDKRLEEVLRALAANSSVAILVENTSNVQEFSSFCHCIDRTLGAITEDELKDFSPELLITIGGAVISKRIKAYFRKYKPNHNWRVGNFIIHEDTFQSLTKAIDIEPVTFIEKIIEQAQPANSNFGGLWKQRDFMAKEKHLAYLSATEFSDLSVFDLLLDLIPADCLLHMGNSSVVRYCQLFDPIKGIEYFSNRGVSGIDGSASTAAGISVYDQQKLNILISGDLSFFYDSNAYWNAELKSNLKIIVINNGGGSIFQIIPGPAKSEHSQTFFAPTTASVEGICKAYDLNFYQAKSIVDISKSIDNFFSMEENDRPSVLEIATQNCENASVLEGYFTNLAK
jgi:2-succinyl-5-enolpyruvyl-6-hydroxy-3-cyclohexene-1-carboxylate synthase